MIKNLLFYFTFYMIFAQSGQAMLKDESNVTTVAYLPRSSMPNDTFQIDGNTLQNTLQNTLETFQIEWETPQQRGKILEDAMEQNEESRKAFKDFFAMVSGIEEREKKDKLSDVLQKADNLRTQINQVKQEECIIEQKISYVYKQRRNAFSKELCDYVNKKTQDQDNFIYEKHNRIDCFLIRIKGEYPSRIGGKYPSPYLSQNKKQIPTDVEKFYENIKKLSEDVEKFYENIEKKQKKLYCLKLGIQKNAQDLRDTTFHPESEMKMMITHTELADMDMTEDEMDAPITNDITQKAAKALEMEEEKE